MAPKQATDKSEKPRRGKPTGEKLWDHRHNMCSYLVEAEKFEDFHQIMSFLKRSRIHYAIATECVVYEGHMKEFWETATIEKKDAHVEFIQATVKKVSISVSEELIRRVLHFGDQHDDPLIVDRKLCRGCCMRMGYKGDLRMDILNKSGFPVQIKYLLHVLIHCMGHRKGGYEVAGEKILSMMTALALNLKFNFSKLIFEHMKDNLGKKVRSANKFWMFPRFLQMIINAVAPGLEKKEEEIMKISKMGIDTLKQIRVYKQAVDLRPANVDLFGHFVNVNYAVKEGHCRSADSDTEATKAVENIDTILAEAAQKKKKRAASKGASSSRQVKKKKTLLVDEDDVNVDVDQVVVEGMNVDKTLVDTDVIVEEAENVEVDEKGDADDEGDDDDDGDNDDENVDGQRRIRGRNGKWKLSSSDKGKGKEKETGEDYNPDELKKSKHKPELKNLFKRNKKRNVVLKVSSAEETVADVLKGLAGLSKEVPSTPSHNSPQPSSPNQTKPSTPPSPKTKPITPPLSPKPTSPQPKPALSHQTTPPQTSPKQTTPSLQTKPASPQTIPNSPQTIPSSPEPMTPSLFNQTTPPQTFNQTSPEYNSPEPLALSFPKNDSPLITYPSSPEHITPPLSPKQIPIPSQSDPSSSSPKPVDGDSEDQYYEALKFINGHVNSIVNIVNGHTLKIKSWKEKLEKLSGDGESVKKFLYVMYMDMNKLGETMESSLDVSEKLRKTCAHLFKKHQSTQEKIKGLHWEIDLLKGFNKEVTDKLKEMEKEKWGLASEIFKKDQLQIKNSININHLKADVGKLKQEKDYGVRSLYEMIDRERKENMKFREEMKREMDETMKLREELLKEKEDKGGIGSRKGENC